VRDANSGDIDHEWYSFSTLKTNTLLICPLASYFDIRTRSLNSFLFTASQFFASWAIAGLLDSGMVKNSGLRKLTAVACVFSTMLTSWVVLIVWYLQHGSQSSVQSWSSASFPLACASVVLHGCSLSVVCYLPETCGLRLMVAVSNHHAIFRVCFTEV
jgi:hypothetical protein